MENVGYAYNELRINNMFSSHKTLSTIMATINPPLITSSLTGIFDFNYDRRKLFDLSKYRHRS